MSYNSFESDSQRYISSIINILNDVDDEFKQLKDMLAAKDRVFQFVVFDASKTLEKAFYNCQVVGETIRQGHQKGFLTKKQVEALNQQLKSEMEKITHYSQELEVFQQMQQASLKKSSTGMSY